MIKRRALLMINRHCRQGGADPDAILRQFAARGIAVEQISPAGEEETAAEIKARAGGVDLLVLGGGDGTLRSAAAAEIGRAHV